MNYVIICMMKNSGKRVYDWIKYHAFIGFDSFVLFDDYSEDDTIEEVKRAQKDFSQCKISYFNTTKNQDYINYSIKECENSAISFDKSTAERQLQSYTLGNNFVKSINPKAICAFIDVDEFIFLDTHDITIFKSLFEKHNCSQIRIFNFDILDNYQLEKNFLFNNNFLRWDYEDTSNHTVWKHRTKCIVISGLMNFCNDVHGIAVIGNTHDLREYNIARLIHFRKPNLVSDNIKFVPDLELNYILKKINEQNSE